MKRLRHTAAFPALIAMVAACGTKAPPQAAGTHQDPALLVVDTATVEVPLSLPSQVYSDQDTWVYARSTGIVDSFFVDLGSTVQTGEVLATLESTDQTLALQRADVSWDAANRAETRARELAKTKNITAADVEQAETDFRQADIARAQARRALALTRVTAPFAGVVAARSAVRAGRLVAAGDSLLRVTALSPLRVAIHVPEAQARGLVAGTTASVLGSGATARATVIRVAPTVDAASGTRELVLELAGSRGVRPGASVTVRLGGERRRVTVVPAAAISDSGYVIVWQDGRTSVRPVTLGPTLPDGRVEVISGLTVGERLLPGRP